MQQKRRRRNSTTEQTASVRPTPLRTLNDDPRFLESRVASLFRRLGYRVSHRPATHDQGFDLAVSRPGLRAIVQCKRWHHPVGPAVIRDLYGTLLHTGADLGILATTSTVSRSARQFAQGKPLLIIDGALLRLLLPDSR